MLLMRIKIKVLSQNNADFLEFISDNFTLRYVV